MPFRFFKRRKHPPAAVWIRVVRTLGLTVLIIGGIYLYQPQRYDFFPRPAPVPNPFVDPDAKALFKAGARVAVVAAHPDDPEYFISGTLLKLHRAGARITIVMCTDGDKGYYPWFLTDANRNRLVRRAEQLTAARQYDADVYFLGRRDGRLKADALLVASVRDVLEKIKPDFLLAFDPLYPPRIQHRDHLQSGVAAIAASEHLPNLKKILLFSTHAPNYIDDVTDHWDQRIDLLAIHKSQWTGDRLLMLQSTIEDRSSAEGALRNFSYGEGFRIVNPSP